MDFRIFNEGFEKAREAGVNVPEINEEEIVNSVSSRSKKDLRSLKLLNYHFNPSDFKTFSLDTQNYEIANLGAKKSFKCINQLVEKNKKLNQKNQTLEEAVTFGKYQETLIKNNQLQIENGQLQIENTKLRKQSEHDSLIRKTSKVLVVSTLVVAVTISLLLH